MREAGLEPARPEWTLEPESSESANSTTRAYAFFECSNNIAHGSRVVNPFFWKFRPCLQARPVCAMPKANRLRYTVARDSFFGNPNEKQRRWLKTGEKGGKMVPAGAR